MRSTAAALLAVTLLLSGCFTEADNGDDETTSGTTSTTGTTTGPGGNATNHAPTATLEATKGNGSASLNVTFLLNGTDADNDTLSWKLSLGDNSTSEGDKLPTNVTYGYGKAGLYNVTLQVSDGKQTTNVSLQLNVTGGTPFTQFVATGTPDLACPQCSTAGANTGAGYRSGTNELDSWFVELPAGAAGQPFTLTGESGNPDLVFRDSCASTGAAVGEAFVGDGDEAGVVPEGATCALTWNPADVVAAITLTIG